jgi:ribosomal protein S18 acetylase RimI-like enzyme
MYQLDRRCFEPGIAFTRAQIETFLELESLEGVAAEARGRLVGFAIGYLRRPTLGGVLTLDVDPGQRRRGLGRALFAELLARLKRAGASAVRLEVDVRNTGAIAFYRSFGFRKLGRLTDYYGERKDAFEMERAARPRHRVSTARGETSS